MAKKKCFTWITALVIISLCASGCGAKTETPTDENVKVTSETPTPPKDDEKAADDEYEEEDAESSGIPEVATSFAESLRKALADLESTTTVSDPEDQGEGKYTIALGGDSTLLYTIQTDGSSALSYAATIIGGEDVVIKNVFSILVMALLDGSNEMQAAGDAIVSGQSPVMTEAYTFTSTSGEIEGQPFATLTAVVNGGEGENSGVPNDVTSFAESLKKIFVKHNAGITINAPENIGDGKYALETSKVDMSFTVQTDDSSALSYTVIATDDDAGFISGAYTTLIAALLEGAELDETLDAIITREESPVETEDYTFTIVTGETEGRSFSTLTAVVN